MKKIVSPKLTHKHARLNVIVVSFICTTCCAGRQMALIKHSNGPNQALGSGCEKKLKTKGFFISLFFGGQSPGRRQRKQVSTNARLAPAQDTHRANEEMGNVQSGPNDGYGQNSFQGNTDSFRGNTVSSPFFLRCLC